MSNITNTQLLEIIDDTLEWASELSEQWTGTMVGRVINSQQAQLIKAVDNGDLELAYSLVHNLGQTLDYAQKENNDKINKIYTNSNDPYAAVR